MGFRQIEVKGTQILLNGKPVFSKESTTTRCTRAQA